MADGGQSGTALAQAGPAEGSALQRATALFSDAGRRLQSMPPARRARMGASALLVAAICAGMFWYAGRPDWRVLFSGLDAKDTQQIAQELAAAGIAYNMTEDGSGIEVSADQVDKARMEVAAKGMPQSGRMGFELFDKPNWVGSEFDEKVNYQRALEGELEHTIGTLSVVRSARVHLVIPKESLFGEAQQTAKASVVLQLRRSQVPPEQAESIRNLVAGAVENLAPEQVTLVDADGRLNLSAPGQGAVAADEEQALEEKLVTMLEPTAGGGNVRATVNLAYDQSSEEKTDDVYDPAQVVPLSTHKVEQSTGARARAVGIPGTASNTPGGSVPGSAQASAASAKAPTAAPVPPLMQTASAAQSASPLPVYPQSGLQTDGQTMTEESNSYAVTRHTQHSEQGPGRIRRITAAVVVNDRMGSEGVGKLAHTLWKPRSPEEMQQMDQLARAAVGFDASRGDQVVIENVSFTSNVPELAPAGFEKVMDETQSVLHTQPGLLRTMGFAVVGLLLVLVVLKPMTQQIMTTLSQTPVLALSASQPQDYPAANGGRAATRAVGQSSMPSLASLVAAKRPTDTQEIYEHISEQIHREPAQSTRLLESWINAPVEEDE